MAIRRLIRRSSVDRLYPVKSNPRLSFIIARSSSKSRSELMSSATAGAHAFSRSGTLSGATGLTGSELVFDEFFAHRGQLAGGVAELVGSQRRLLGGDPEAGRGDRVAAAARRLGQALGEPAAFVQA